MIVITIIATIITAVVNIFFAIAIFHDATERHDHDNYIWFVHPVVWALATLVGGVFAAAIYWALHYAAFAANFLPADTQSPPDVTPRS